MGWDTQIIIIVENIESIKESKSIGKQIYDKDSKRYGKETFYIIEGSLKFSIFYTYERRKYAPYWSIEEISKIYPNAQFTILGSMLDFLCGPGGLFNIKNGKIVDSYGIWGDKSKRHRSICHPNKFKYQIYDWFSLGGNENKLRIKAINEFPLGSCNDNLVDKVIPLDESETEFTIDEKELVQKRSNWVIQKHFEPIISQSAYEELRSKTNSTKINEESFIAFVAYSPEISKMESTVLENLKGEIFQASPFRLYDITFGERSSDFKLLQSEFNYLEDLEDRMKRRSKDIIEWAMNQLKKKENIKLAKGASISWMINMIKEERASS